MATRVRQHGVSATPTVLLCLARAGTSRAPTAALTRGSRRTSTVCQVATAPAIASSTTTASAATYTDVRATIRIADRCLRLETRLICSVANGRTQKRLDV